MAFQRFVNKRGLIGVMAVSIRCQSPLVFSAMQSNLSLFQRLLFRNYVFHRTFFAWCVCVAAIARAASQSFSQHGGYSARASLAMSTAMLSVIILVLCALRIKPVFRTRMLAGVGTMAFASLVGFSLEALIEDVVRQGGLLASFQDENVYVWKEFAQNCTAAVVSCEVGYAVLRRYVTPAKLEG